MKKLAIPLVLAAIAIVLTVSIVMSVCWFTSSQVQNRLIVRNESGQTATFVTITVGGETIRFEEILTGQSLAARFHIRTDDHFVVRICLADGTEVHHDCGYVTGGMYGEHAEFIIRPGGVLEFKQGPGRS